MLSIHRSAASKRHNTDDGVSVLGNSGNDLITISCLAGIGLGGVEFAAVLRTVGLGKKMSMSRLRSHIMVIMVTRVTTS